MYKFKKNSRNYIESIYYIKIRCYNLKLYWYYNLQIWNKFKREMLRSGYKV